MENIKEEIAKLESKLAEIKQYVEKQETTRVSVLEAGGDDTELLKQCANVLEYATYHDGRYGQANNYNRFFLPATELVEVLAKRLNRPAYSGFTSSV